MPLHPQAQAFVDSLAEESPPGWEELSVHEARAAFEAFEPMFGDRPSLQRVEDIVLAGVPARLYSESAEKKSPLVMYFHGGGWVLGNLETHDALCRRLAMYSGCTVVAVDYGLSPENPFPGPVDQCYRATREAVDRADQLNVDGSKVAVAGDSAGGQLAAAVTLKARENSAPSIALQVLIYPVIEPNFETESYRRCASGLGLSRASMRWFWSHFLGDQTPTALAAPIRAESLAGLPPAIVVTAEYDVLHDEGKAYAQRLSNDGVDVQYKCYEGMLHGFIHFAGLFDPGIEAAQEIGTEVGRRLTN